MNDERRLEELEANARHASERYRLYRAKTHGAQPTSTGRLRELQRESEIADRMLARARSTPQGEPGDLARARSAAQGEPGD